MIAFLTDPHLGLRRQAHTTPASLKALRNKLFEVVDSINRRFRDVPKICLGDWFDKAHNDEETLLRAHELATEQDIILGGNHDMINDAEALSSLMLLESIAKTRNVFTASFGGTTVSKKVYEADKLEVYMVAHHSTQELFEQALQDACGHERTEGYSRILLLHCNYDSPFATHETTLNITEDDAEFLLEHFDYVMLGHEHQPRDLHGGRLIVLGNTHPTSFADISMKRVAVWENGKIRFEEIWNPQGRYLKVHYNDLESVDFSAAQFVHVHGEIAAGEILSVMRTAKRLTKEAPNLYMLRLDLKTAELGKVEREAVVGKMTLPQRIELELQAAGDPASLELWREITAEV